MVRRSKADAQATRNRLLDAAEHVFQERGVSRTSLNDIAAAAGTTRGAIYWHFKDKADLFNAMMDRVTLPMEEAFECAVAPDTQDPVAEIRAAMLQALGKTATDAQTRRVFEVATHKVEYVPELMAVQQRHLRVRKACRERVRLALERAIEERGRPLPVPAGAAATGLHALVNGLIQNWLLDAEAFDLMDTGRQVIDTYLAGLGLMPQVTEGEIA